MATTAVIRRVILLAVAAFLAAAAATAAATMEPIAPATPPVGGAALAFGALLAVAIAWSAVLEVRYRQRTR